MNLSFIASRCTNALVSYLRWPSGGAGQAVLNFVKALPEKRHVVLFYECNTKWGLAAQPEWLISELEKYAAVFFLKPLITDRRKGTVSYDEFINKHDGLNYFAASLLSKSTLIIHHWVSRDCALLYQGIKCPKVCVSHSIFPVEQGYDVYVFPSKFSFEWHMEVCNSLKKIVYNAVDINYWVPQRKRPSKLQRIGRVSSFHPSKFPEGYLEMIQSLLIQMPHVKHIIVGAGESFSFFYEVITSHRLKKQIDLPGELIGNSLLSMVQSFDACLYFTGSHIEIHPLALLEIMACGVPGIAERKGGLPEIITQNISGFLCSNWDEAVSTLRRIYSDPDLLRQLQIGARKSAKKFDLSFHRKSWKSILNDFIPSYF